MKTVQEALQTLLAQARAINEFELLPVQEALGRVLAQDVASLVDVPPLDNTQMDGYAVRASDIHPNQLYTVSQRIPAGYIGEPLVSGTVARIFTGASIPEGADAVVMQEDCEVIGEVGPSGIGHSIRIKGLVKSGQWIRRQGEDLKAHQPALRAGAYLRPQELGVAASAGLTHLNVKRRLKVAVFFTGDELVLPGQALKPGAIYNSNRDTLLGCIKALGCDATDFGIVPDTLGATRATLRAASVDHDLIITSGGVSVGEEDHIKPAVTAEGRLDLWQIAIKPGKPLAFGAVRKALPGGSHAETWFMGLPGNPVASFVTFMLFVRPFVLALQGRSERHLPAYQLRADFDWPKADKRNEFLRVRINQAGGLDLFPNQSSGVLTSASWADGLVDNPPQKTIARGDIVQFIPFSSILA